jgi:hypothetical protein
MSSPILPHSPALPSAYVVLWVNGAHDKLALSTGVGADPHGLVAAAVGAVAGDAAEVDVDEANGAFRSGN